MSKVNTSFQEANVARDSSSGSGSVMPRLHAHGVPPAVITLRSTVDNTRGPFTVYTFAASLMRDGTAAPLGTVV